MNGRQWAWPGRGFPQASDGPGSETSKSKSDVYARASVCGCDGGEVVVVVVVVGGVIGSLHQSPHLGVFSSR